MHSAAPWVCLDLRRRAPVSVIVRLIGLSAAALLTACVTAPRPAVPSAEWSERLGALQAIRHFQLQGRIAASNGQEGFSAGLRWLQQDADSSIDLAAPLGFGAAHIERSTQTLQVTTSKGVTLSDEAATEQLRASLGFDAPFDSLRYWLLGASAPASSAQPTLDAQQRLIHLEQAGWKIDLADYQFVQQQWLPRRLTVTREALRLRVVIDSWQL